MGRIRREEGEREGRSEGGDVDGGGKWVVKGGWREGDGSKKYHLHGKYR